MKRSARSLWILIAVLLLASLFIRRESFANYSTKALMDYQTTADSVAEAEDISAGLQYGY